MEGILYNLSFGQGLNPPNSNYNTHFVGLTDIDAEILGNIGEIWVQFRYIDEISPIIAIKYRIPLTDYWWDISCRPSPTHNVSPKYRSLNPIFQTLILTSIILGVYTSLQFIED